MNWEALYRNKVCAPAEAVQSIESGQRVFVSGNAAYPQALINALMERAGVVTNVEILHLLSFGEAPYADPALARHFRHNAMFIGANVRTAVQQGLADFTPIFLSEAARLFTSGQLTPDVALIQLSPPDEHGFCSYGCEVAISKAAAESARVVIAEVNRQMPRTLGDSFIHLSRLHRLVEVDRPLPQVRQGSFDEIQARIGQNVAELVPQGATLQLGIGAIPDAVLAALATHRDLGVHTEMFSDGIVDLVEQGIISGATKTLHRGKIVAGFCFGTQKLYDFIADNPIIEMHPTEYVNDPFVVAQNDAMIAINSALQVDLTGQVCADSLGTRFYSGVGGQVDFMRGASRSKGGKPIIALPATAKSGAISRIVPTLEPGAGVTTTRNDIHYVVTEYGVAYLHGKTIRERALALMKIAAPRFREELLRFAREEHYVL
ncbi:MAG: hypothetical protein M5U01_05755 [Ardenticatenaceae bacterium]|nr:hypothetical protein [Ardenticatenaceae bacterium]HBY98041.1 4-hydroxybutyrate CoA-transferase [Chloroflexota bacterium]